MYMITDLLCYTAETAYHFTQYCKATILQLRFKKINNFSKKKEDQAEGKVEQQ